MNEKLKIIKGRSLWGEAEYLLAQARAYRDAAIAAEVIDEIETANAWRNRSVELETQASHLFTEAKTLGVFASPNAEPLSRTVVALNDTVLEVRS